MEQSKHKLVDRMDPAFPVFLIEGGTPMLFTDNLN